MEMSDDDDEIGYRKPPRHTRFKPGQSGNPKGRPKGAKNLKTELMEELQERIAIRESGQAKTVSKQRAMLKALTAKAVQGDTRAANLVIGMVYRLLSDEPEDSENENLSDDDLRILKSYEARLLEGLHRKEKKDATK